MVDIGAVLLSKRKNSSDLALGVLLGVIVTLGAVILLFISYEIFLGNRSDFASKFWGIVDPKATLATWIGTGFSIVAAYILWRTLRATQAMSEVTREIGSSQSRAWLSVEVSLERQEWQQDHSRMYFTCQMLVENHGHSPAIEVSAFAAVSFWNDINGDVNAILRKYCSELNLGSFGTSECVFPASPGRFGHGLSLDRDQLLAEKNLKGGVALPVLAVCILYKCLHTGETHRAGSAFLIGHAPEVDNGTFLPIDPDTDRWGKELIRLIVPAFATLVV